MNEDKQKRLKTRLNRIAGQIGGVQRMVDEDRYCVDILTQIAAIRSALDTVGVELLTNHIEGCVVGHGTESEHECAKKMTQQELVEEVRTSLGRFLK
ncbi:MAG: metal-sensitive transcriptional regulator [Armatimonadota bacterium]